MLDHIELSEAMGIYKPTDEQREVLETDDSALVVAGPGRGKTVTAIAAARAWLARTPEPAKVLFTSFSNAAVRRIAAAAGINPAGLERRVRLRTIHSIAMEVLGNYGRFVGLRRPARPLDRIEEHLIAAERGWDHSDDEKRRAVLSALARNEGLVAFDLMIPLATALLRASQTIRRAVGCQYPFIIIDEFQDTRPDQWMLLKLLGEESRVVALGDPNQMIYESQYQAAKRRINEFCSWKRIEPISFEGPNFRCQVNEIVTFAECLLHGRRYTHVDGGRVQFAAAYPNQRRAVLAVIWRELRQQVGRAASIAIITPSSGSARNLAAELRAPDQSSTVPFKVHAQVEGDRTTLDAFRLAVCAAADWVRDRTGENKQRLGVALAVFVTRWSRRKLTAELISMITKRLSAGLRSASPVRDYLSKASPEPLADFAHGLLAAMEEDREFASAGAALRKQGLPNMWAITLAQGSLYDEYRSVRANVGLQGLTISSAPTTLLSMYRAKGREFDFVILVVEPRDHSSKVTLDELQRLYYVSATRAREWLGVLHVPGRPGPILGPVLGK